MSPANKKSELISDQESLVESSSTTKATQISQSEKISNQKISKEKTLKDLVHKHLKKNHKKYHDVRYYYYYYTTVV